MGMFDTVKLVGHALPDEGEQHRETAWWQTKDFDCSMETIRIQNGRLVRDKWHYEETPKEQRPFPNAEPGTLQSICGILRTVIDERDVDMNFHGVMSFGCYLSKTQESFSYEAKFTDGNLVSITRVPE